MPWGNIPPAGAGLPRMRAKRAALGPPATRSVPQPRRSDTSHCGASGGAALRNGRCKAPPRAAGAGVPQTVVFGTLPSPSGRHREKRD
jgi:hypothetical protein